MSRKPDIPLAEGPDHLAQNHNREEAQRQQELDDIAEILSLPSGIRFFRRLIAAGKVFSTTYTGNSHGYFLEGQRNLALMILQDAFDAAPKRIPDVLKPDEDEDGDNA